MSYPEIAGLVGQLASLRANPGAAPLDVCAFAESTFAMSRCAWIEAARARDALDAEAAARRARWDAATQAAWREVARAGARWASADAALRADELRGGTLQKGRTRAETSCSASRPNASRLPSLPAPVLGSHPSRMLPSGSRRRLAIRAPRPRSPITLFPHGS
jgi:hypothetical protein